jgi:hypothetical protein
MAEEHTSTNVETEVQDRGVFDFLKKDEDKKPDHETLATELEKTRISDCEEKKVEEEKKPSLLEKLHRSDSSSSSSSEEEVEEDGEKIRRKKKKGLKEKVEEKFSGEKKEEEVHVIAPTEDTSIPIEKYDAPEVVVAHDGEVPHPEEKKTFIEKIKEKLPGGHKKPEESAAAPVAPAPVEAVPTPAPAPVEEAEPSPKEKKGILEKIKEKLPGYHKTDEEKKETTDH